MKAHLLEGCFWSSFLPQPGQNFDKVSWKPREICISHEPRDAFARKVPFLRKAINPLIAFRRNTIVFVETHLQEPTLSKTLPFSAPNDPLFMKTKITLSAHELGLDDVFSRLAGLKTESTRASALRFLLPHLIEVGRLPQWFLDIPSQCPLITSQITIRLDLREDEPALSRVLQWLMSHPSSSYPRQIKHLLSSASAPADIRLPAVATQVQTTTQPASPPQPAALPQPAPMNPPASPQPESGLATRTRSAFSNASSFFQSTFEPTQP